MVISFWTLKFRVGLMFGLTFSLKVGLPVRQLYVLMKPLRISMFGLMLEVRREFGLPPKIKFLKIRSLGMKRWSQFSLSLTIGRRCPVCMLQRLVRLRWEVFTWVMFSLEK